MKEFNTTEIVLSTRRIIVSLSITCVVLVVAGIFAKIFSYIKVDNYLIAEVLESFVRLFSLDLEANIPTWYSSLLLLIASTTLASISFLTSKSAGGIDRHWAFLAILFLGLSIDESALIHEMLAEPMKMVTGYQNLGWIAVEILLVAAFVITYVKFLLGLDSSTRILIIIAGAIYVLGSLGFDAIDAVFLKSQSESSLVHIVITTLEETLEMVGIIIFIFALL